MDFNMHLGHIPKTNHSLRSHKTFSLYR